MLGKRKKDFISKETILKNVKNYTKLLNRQCKNDINIDTKDALFGFDILNILPKRIISSLKNSKMIEYMVTTLLKEKNVHIT